QGAAHPAEVGRARADPVARSFDGPGSARGNAEVEVGEVCDAQALELRRQPAHRSGERPQTHPPRLEVTPREGRSGRSGEAPDDAACLQWCPGASIPEDRRAGNRPSEKVEMPPAARTCALLRLR